MVHRQLLVATLCLILVIHLATRSKAFCWHRSIASLQRTTFLHSTEQDDSSATIRLNKVFKATHSRRQADKLIEEGRVSVNGEVSYGCMLTPHRDVVSLDGNVVRGWERMNAIDSQTTATSSKQDSNSQDAFEYVKYWKPRGVICTTDQRIAGNIIEAITQRSGYQPQHRVFPVGRLDKDSSGLILLTSDGRLPNASLRSDEKQSKQYRVRVDRPLTVDIVEQLRSGVVITTVAQRDGKAKPLTAPTRPCQVHQTSPTTCQITLQEGRNRQIRKMMDALGYTVKSLHRVGFGPISIRDLEGPGDWRRLDPREMEWVDALVGRDGASIVSDG